MTTKQHWSVIVVKVSAWIFILGMIAFPICTRTWGRGNVPEWLHITLMTLIVVSAVGLLLGAYIFAHTIPTQTQISEGKRQNHQ